MENSTGGHGSSGASRAGRRTYHKWNLVVPGLHVCAHCRMRRKRKKISPRKWKVYYRKVGSEDWRPLKESRRVPRCRPQTSIES
jgi:hypothetical protein